VRLSAVIAFLFAASACTGKTGPTGEMGEEGPEGPAGAGVGSSGPLDSILTSNGSGGAVWSSSATLQSINLTTGPVGIGTTSPQTMLDVATENGSDSLQLRRYTNDSNAVKIDFAKALGTIAAPLAVASGTQIFTLIAYAYDGGAFQNSGDLRFSVDTGFGTGVTPGVFQIFTADPTGVVRQRMRVDSLGHWAAPANVAPTLTGCGTNAAVDGTDVSGTITEGTAATGCTITFANSYSTNSTTPHCTVTSQSGLSFSYTTNATAITIVNIGPLSQTSIDYTCIGS
jgi:hypothetical protein